MDLRSPTIALGLNLFAVFLTFWWSLDYKRFLKFYGVRPPYRRSVVIGFRVFWLLCFLAALIDLLFTRLPAFHGTFDDYARALGTGAVGLAIAFVMVRFVEWLADRSYKSKSQPPTAKGML